MLHILGIILPVFGLIGIGYGARITGLIRDRTGDGLADYVFAIAIPCLIFKTLAESNIPISQPWGYWLSYFGAVAMTWFVSQFIATRVFGLNHGEAVVAGFSGAQANTVLVGVPLILEAYGHEGAVPLFLLIAVHLPIMFGTATLLIEGRNMSPRIIARQIFGNPILIAILVSSAVQFTGLSIPDSLQQLIHAIAASATPCALIAMGIALNRYGIGSHVNLTLILSATKLILHPAIVFILAHYVFAMPPVWAGVAVLFASSPSGINAYLFAERYKTGVPIASGAIAVSTALSVLSTAFWLFVLKIQ